MIYAIVRMYATEHDARQALAKVQAEGLGTNDCNIVTPASGSSEAALVHAITSGLVLASDAHVYAKGVMAGKSLVSITPPPGMGRLYTFLLDTCHPVDSGVSEVSDGPMWDEATPLSCMLGLPVLTKPSGYSMLGLPQLTRTGCTVFGRILPELADSSFAIFGEPNLSHNPSPFSSLLKLPLLRG
jgi:hypothetical protein